MSEDITVLVERCTMQIHLDAFFTQMPLVKIKKLLGYVFQEPWRNEETIRILGTYLPQKQAEAKDAWHKASIEYQDGYRLPHNYPVQNPTFIERNNKKLLTSVKQSKSKQERWGKIIAHFETLKHKM